MTGSVLGVLHLIVAIWAVLNIMKSSASTQNKVLWLLLVLLVPIIGLVVWYLAGPKG